MMFNKKQYRAGKTYDYVIVSHLPAFYKINLYNELSKKLNIFVIFISSQSEKRTKDFVSLKCDFNYAVLNDGCFETRPLLGSILKLIRIIINLRYKRLLVGGWDLAEYWWLAFFSQKRNNALTLESTILESKAEGIKGLIKKIFLSRINVVFASGKLHVDLLRKLKYSGQIKVTRGVGIINKPLITFEQKKQTYNKRFLYLGRLSAEKNLNMLISVFNNLPDYFLSIVGSGPLRQELEKIANANISFIEHINNNELNDLFLLHDLLILPSVSEPWGLVVEEAIYFGLPAIVSKNCGVSEMVKHGLNGFLFDCTNPGELENIIKSINSEEMMRLSKESNSGLIIRKDKRQVGVYALLGE